MSKLQGIIDAIAALPIEVNGVVTASRFGDTLTNSAEIPDLPIRLIAAPNTGQGGKSRAATLGANHVMTVEWQIQDLVLFRFMGSGLGLQDISQTYIDTHISIADTARLLGARDWTLVRWDATNGVTEWPAGSGNKYNSITVLYTVQEIVQ